MVSDIISEKSIHDFLMVSLFGEGFNPNLITNSWDDRESKIDLAIKRAYRDMNRTLRTKEHQAEWDSLKEDVTKLINDCVKRFVVIEDGRDSYDKWFNELIISMVNSQIDVDGIILKYKYGQAQKWVNMTMKYLFIADVPGIADAFYFCHVPIDTYIINAAEEQLNLKRPALPWSQMDDYKEYAAYEKQIRMRLGNVAPLEWELKTWTKMAVSKKETEHTNRAKRAMK